MRSSRLSRACLVLFAALVLAPAFALSLAACSPWTLPPTSPGPFNFLGPDDLAAQGFTLEVINQDETLACRKDHGCVCLRKLSCCDSCTSEAGAGGENHCISLAYNLAIFRKELEGKGEAPVLCEFAETGTCGSFTYFEFQGGMFRDEIRYFGPDGRLIGQRNQTDYNAYCDRRTSRQYQGRIPACRERTAFRQICGLYSDSNDRGLMIDDLTR